ncbi:hypothetical protein JCM8097_000999 [Rhodosporidiobolus ruineniae]
MAASALTLFSNRACPWCHRVTLALREVGAYDKGLTHTEIDLQNKPGWYTERINAAGKVPVLQIGADDDPNKALIPESGVVLELVGDLFPQAGLVPKDPVETAKARFQEVLNTPFTALWLRSDASQVPAVLSGVDEVQSLLAKQPGKFLLGDKPTIGDLAVAPFVGRLFAFSKGGLVPDSLTAPLTTEEKYAPFRAYHEALTSRPSWKETFNEEEIVQQVKAFVKKMRAK